MDIALGDVTWRMPHNRFLLRLRRFDRIEARGGGVAQLVERFLVIGCDALRALGAAQQRLVESPYIEWVGHGYTVADGLEMRPAEYNWHLNFTRQAGVLRTLVVGALEVARPLSYIAGGESFTRLGVLSAQWSSCARESPTGHCPRTWLRRSASPDPLTETLPGLYPT